jgi:hypothetical protein
MVFEAKIVVFVLVLMRAIKKLRTTARPTNNNGSNSNDGGNDDTICNSSSDDHDNDNKNVAYDDSSNVISQSIALLVSSSSSTTTSKCSGINGNDKGKGGKNKNKNKNKSGGHNNNELERLTQILSSIPNSINVMKQFLDTATNTNTNINTNININIKPRSKKTSVVVFGKAASRWHQLPSVLLDIIWTDAFWNKCSSLMSIIELVCKGWLNASRAGLYFLFFTLTLCLLPCLDDFISWSS